MKGLILAGGHGTRLRPLTFTGNKHLLPIANKPMVFYGLEHLRNAGIKDIAVILGPLREGFAELVGNGSSFGVNLTYIEQPIPLGLAHAALISKDFMHGDPFIMYLGDNLLRDGVLPFKRKFEREKLDCVIGVSEAKDPTRFGVVELANGKVVSLVEKPKHPKSNLALVGVYVFGPKIFDAISKIKPSARNELEITEAIQQLINDGGKVGFEKVTGWWKDTGRPEDLLEANQLVLSGLQPQSYDLSLPPDAILTGNVVVGKGTKFSGKVRVLGPVIIGDDCVIGPEVYIGPYTSIGDKSVLDHAEIENSIVMSGVNLQSGKRVTDSLIGSSSVIKNADLSLPRGYKLIIGERSFAQI